MSLTFIDKATFSNWNFFNASNLLCSNTKISMTKSTTSVLYINTSDYSISKFDSNELNDDSLTIMCMFLSEKSLAEDWENEDDERWNKLLLNE
ncbi:MAG TPA: hypothetical protein VMU83_22205 [Hanamia sp.]|nr:hypothetical protein [Hanamia sp.]